VDLVTQPRRDEVWLVALGPTRGSEIRKTRPCLIVSPDEINQSLRTAIIAPMTTTMRAYPTRVILSFQGKQGQVALDQIRAIDHKRLVRKLGTVSANTARTVSSVLVEMFQREGEIPG
jgi:mRNA interferase MazF